MPTYDAMSCMTPVVVDMCLLQRKLAPVVLSDTFSLASLGNGVAAIIAGVLSTELTNVCQRHHTHLLSLLLPCRVVCVCVAEIAVLSNRLTHPAPIGDVVAMAGIRSQRLVRCFGNAAQFSSSGNSVHVG
jgi:hypothetical protein